MRRCGSVMDTLVSKRMVRWDVTMQVVAMASLVGVVHKVRQRRCLWGWVKLRDRCTSVSRFVDARIKLDLADDVCSPAPPGGVVSGLEAALREPPRLTKEAVALTIKQEHSRNG